MIVVFTTCALLMWSLIVLALLVYYSLLYWSSIFQFLFSFQCSSNGVNIECSWIQFINVAAVKLFRTRLIENMFWAYLLERLTETLLKLALFKIGFNNSDLFLTDVESHYSHQNIHCLKFSTKIHIVWRYLQKVTQGICLAPYLSSIVAEFIIIFFEDKLC